MPSHWLIRWYKTLRHILWQEVTPQKECGLGVQVKLYNDILCKDPGRVAMIVKQVYKCKTKQVKQKQHEAATFPLNCLGFKYPWMYKVIAKHRERIITQNNVQYMWIAFHLACVCAREAANKCLQVSELQE